TEGLFARIQHHRKTDYTYWDASEGYWEVTSKDGLVSLYGTPRPAAGPPVQPDQPGQAWRDPAIIASPEHTDQIFAWKLTCTIDPFGNRIEYLYEREVSQSVGPHSWEQTYLSEIRYIDYGENNNASMQFLVSVTFDYDSQQQSGHPPRYRPDPFSGYRAGFEIRTLRRCNAIRVTSHADSDRPVRTYHLLYLDQRGLPPEHLPMNGVSLLSQVQVEGHDAATSEWLPPLEFAYTAFSPNIQRFFPITGPNMPPRSLASPDYELVDLIGNGLPDILQMNGTVRYWRNAGGGLLDWPQEMHTAPGGLGLADPGVQMIDANGDGRVDLLVT
ncbi:MAG TPA: SpvB/TcaC N-terminal domain-containing protein, partial [Ktedonobacteraceae bacterium]|nr:SpvB/TcaC N-terminal domain-containing protein [Ktedonobacteraceae bacterium]